MYHVLAQDDSDKHTKADGKRDALKAETEKLLDVKIRTDKSLEAYKELLDKLQELKR